MTIHFEKGIPTAVDGKEMGAVELVEYLNKLGGENGIGLLDIVENRLVGMKSRGVYETPGGAILYKAINVLETITLDKESSHFKAQWPRSMPISFTTASGTRPCARRCPPLWTKRRRM